MASTDVRVRATVDDLAIALAGETAQALADAIRQRGFASFVLAGGRTPRSVYQCLSTRFHDAVRWQQVHFYWGDERLVSPDDDRSNFRMARESLLDALPVSPDRVHAMPTGLPAATAAETYEDTLRTRFATEWPEFDVVLLGVGDDGHTASLFPGSALLQESRRWVAPARAPVEPRDRLTLTLPALIHARAIFMLATGTSKAPAIRDALSGEPGSTCPASLVRYSGGRVVWWLDAAAAEHLHVG